MKKRSFLCVLLVAVLLAISALLTSCKGIDVSEAKGLNNAFVESISKDDQMGAAALLHPYSEISVGDLVEFIAALKEEAGIDIEKNGLKVESYSSVSSAYYDSEVGGSKVTLKGTLVSGDTKLGFSVTIVENNSGYGIAGFSIE